MNDLIIKDVNFNGAILRAAQDTDNIIWVGVRWVCNGIGLSDGQMKSERKKIQEDMVLSHGTKFHPLGSDNANSDVLCLKLDFLPLWLAKISITPKMKKENPELVEKLVKYQLKAKDILAEAFFGDKNNGTVAREAQTIQLQLPAFPNYNEQFVELNQKIDKLYSDMGKFVKFMMEWKQSFKDNERFVDKAIETYTDTMENIKSDVFINDCKIWKQRIYNLIDTVLGLDNRFTDTADVMRYIYDYMWKNYGIVWEQEIKEYKEQYDCEYKPKTIDIVYNNETYKSIFESVLMDMIESTEIVQITNTETESSVDEMIAPLVEKYMDKSKNGCATYRRVYHYMAVHHKVDWKNHTTRFMKVNCTGKKPSKKRLIITKPQLRKIFKKSVEDMMKIE